MSSPRSDNTSSPDVMLLAPLAPPRPSLARKRAAASALTLIEPLRVPSRVPSSLSLSSESSLDSSDDDSSLDLRKRIRHDSGISMLSDDSDSQSSLSGSIPDLSPSFYASSSSSSHLVGGRHKQRLVPFVNLSVIGDFEIIGSGLEAKAVHQVTKEIYDCKILSDTETLSVGKVICRLNDASSFYSGSDVDELCNMVLSDKAELVEETSGRMILFTPIYKKTLHAFAQEKGASITEADVKPIFQKILRLVSFCHSLGIILRDVKPVRIVFMSNDSIRLSHVSDCVVCDDPNDDVIFEKMGSPAYVPPEVLSAHGQGYSGKCADMWCLGVLLYLMLLGRYPFYDHTPVGVFQKIKQARVVIPPAARLSIHAQVLIYNLLRKSPLDRPTADEVCNIDWVGEKRVASRGMDRTLATISAAQTLLTELTGAAERRSAASSPGSDSGEPAPLLRRQVLVRPSSADIQEFINRRLSMPLRSAANV